MIRFRLLRYSRTCLQSPFSFRRKYHYAPPTGSLNEAPTSNPFLGSSERSHIQSPSRPSIELRTDNGIIRFSIHNPDERRRDKAEGKKISKKVKMLRKSKVNQLKLYKVKARKKMKSSDPEVRIRYKLEMATRKEEWLIEKLRKFEMPKGKEEAYEPEILTEEEMFYLKRTGEKRKNYVPVGRRGVFGGVVLNMHLHWKKHETVKVTCKPCKPGQVHEYARELSRLSRGTVIDIMPDNVILFYRGKNYVHPQDPQVMSPTNTLSKAQALMKYRYEQSLENTIQFVEKLEKELEDYHEYLAKVHEKNGGKGGSPCSTLPQIHA